MKGKNDALLPVLQIGTIDENAAGDNRSGLTDRTQRTQQEMVDA